MAPLQIFGASSRQTWIAAAALLLFASANSLTIQSARAQTTAKKPPPKAAAPAKTTTPPPSHPSGASQPSPGAKSSPPLKAPVGGAVHATSTGMVAKNSSGKVVGFKGNNGHEATFDPHGNAKVVHAGETTVSRGPGGARRTEIYREDHSRVVAYGHGRGFVEHPYEYGEHRYYARAYYYHGGYYRGYYRGYTYHGVYLYGYTPAYYYPPVYYGWAYNPWPAPVAYGWGWGASPWYGYYGAYFAPYPVYPSAAYWLVDYMVAASLAEAYAAGVAAGANSAQLRHIGPAHLVYASYDPETGTTSPTMTKEVKDAIADEVKLELATAQKTADPGASNSGSLETLLADGKPHVFVASAGLTVSSSGTDCGLTEGDVLALSAPPTEDASSADLRVLASKQADCAKGSTVTVELTDLQEMHNHLLANIDKGMAEMKDHPGHGGLPAPPAEAISGTKEAPYAAAAPAADPNGGADVDNAAQQGAQTEQQVVAEANAPADESGATSAQNQSTSPAQTTTISAGDSIAQVVALKGQPKSILNFPTKQIYVYQDMKITFVDGKLTDVD